MGHFNLIKGAFCREHTSAIRSKAAKCQSITTQRQRRKNGDTVWLLIVRSVKADHHSHGQGWFDKRGYRHVDVRGENKTKSLVSRIRSYRYMLLCSSDFNPRTLTRRPFTCNSLNSVFTDICPHQIPSMLQIAKSSNWPLNCNMAMWWPAVWMQTNSCPTTGLKQSEMW